ncbi:uncharacterized protein F5147DRAFT_773819 [Suillus discolor]|uniref:Uncharacterized protein n=1 Tax=Suillus discolor TaxID=1912936 RepID=A0A9P7F6N4_9AGAM|nr:uncharacterized protein F5147DRAFT_773819 [Suillus discolor]KAG2108238.1 hypothetical protein F5147DRAFT_773819 [Suillus discolor]
MPPARQRVRHSARLQANSRARLKAMEVPPRLPASSRRGKGRAQGSNPKIIVHWTRPSDLHHTDTLVQHITTHSADARILFYKGKKSSATNNNNSEERACGKDKGEIYQALAKLIFEKDTEYLVLYAEEPKKSDLAVCHRVTTLKRSFKEQLDKFHQTGAGVTPLDENGAANLHKQVLLYFPWYDLLHPFLFSNPTCSAKIFTSQLGVDHAATFYVLVHPRGGGASPSARQHTSSPQPPPLQQPLPPPLQQSLPPPLQQSLPPLQHPLPPLQHSLPPSSWHSLPPLWHPGAGGNLIDDPDGDMDDDFYADDDDGVFHAPLGNALDALDGDFEMHDDDDISQEFNSSRCHFISLNSPPKVIGHKRQYAASPSPPRANANSFSLPRKAQTPAYHSCVAFGSASPGSLAPQLSRIMCSCSFPSATGSSSPYISSDYRVSPTASLSTKPQSAVSSKKKKKTSVADMEGHIGMLNGEIQSMRSDLSERRGSKNERYAMKMNYQSQKREYQWCRESHSQDVLLAATTHQREQEAKDKEILRLQAVTALQEKEAETWRLKIQYESMKICAAGGDVSGPSSSS